MRAKQGANAQFAFLRGGEGAAYYESRKRQAARAAEGEVAPKRRVADNATS